MTGSKLLLFSSVLDSVLPRFKIIGVQITRFTVETRFTPSPSQTRNNLALNVWPNEFSISDYEVLRRQQ